MKVSVTGVMELLVPKVGVNFNSSASGSYLGVDQQIGGENMWRLVKSGYAKLGDCTRMLGQKGVGDFGGLTSYSVELPQTSPIHSASGILVRMKPLLIIDFLDEIRKPSHPVCQRLVFTRPDDIAEFKWISQRLRYLYQLSVMHDK